jgi:hypothetical protein
MLATCPLCGGTERPVFSTVAGYRYHACEDCDFLFIAPDLLARIDAGLRLRSYDSAYWAAELPAARERSWGPALARVAEVLLYCRVPVARFIDIGTGPGYLLDALAHFLPRSRAIFHGVELFPPAPEARTSHPNYLAGRLAAAPGPFQAGSCIEVIEHLTPRMVAALARELAGIAAPGACFIFNTGLTDYVRREDAGYLDPVERGHITVWSVPAARRVFGPLGFEVHAIPGKTWAFVAEYRRPAPAGSLTDRIWTALPENLGILRDEQAGSVLHILGLETSRAYR